MIFSRAFWCREFGEECRSWKRREESRSVETAKFITLADSDLIDKICTFLGILKNDSPVPEERLDRVAAFWKALQANPRA
jgi:hypothetical protein